MKKIVGFLLVFFFAFSAINAQKRDGKLDRSIRPKANEAPLIELGETKSLELPNGLKVFVVENHKQPIVAYSLVLDIKPELEKEAAGISVITSDLLLSGTKTKSKDQLDDEIDFIGATISASPKGFYASSLKKQQMKLLELMSDMLLNSEFKQEELDKLKTKNLSLLANQKDDPDAISENVKSVLNYGLKHPYGEIITQETVTNITLEQCQTYYKKYFRPNVAYLAVVGDVTFLEIKELVEKYFGGWQKEMVPVSHYKTPIAPVKTNVAVVNKEGAVQSVINVTYPIDLKMNSEDVIKARVLNNILGGGFSSRLFMNLREKHAYTYGSYSSLNADELVGEFNAYAKVRNSVTDSAISEIIGELNRLRSEKVSQEELDGVKNYLTGNFAIALEDPATIARFAINTERYKLSKDYYKNYLKLLAAVTVEDVYEMAQKYICPENATILVVGNEEEIVKKIGIFSPNKVVQSYDIYGIQKPQNIPLGVTAKSIVSDYIKAIGGEKSLLRIKDFSAKMNTKFQGMDLSIITQKKRINKYCMSIKMGDMLIQKDVYDGLKAQQTTMQGNKEIKGENFDEIKMQSSIFLEMDYQKLGYKLSLKGMESVNGKNAYKMEVITPKGKKIIDYYDVDSKLKVRTLRTFTDDAGLSTQTVDYSEYKEIEGVKFPNVIEMSGVVSMKLVAETIEINKNISDDVFIVE